MAEEYLTIPLTQGKVALINPEDFERVSRHKWCAAWLKCSWYALRWIPERKTTQYLHRFILDAQPGQIIDHVNRDGLDCRRENLRLCTPSQNSMNSRQRIGVSGFKGVSPVNRAAGMKYVAKIRVNGKHRFLGCYESALEAAIVYDRAARAHHGEFAQTNFCEGLVGRAGLEPATP